MFNYAGTSRAGAGAATATPPSSGSIRQTNQQPSKPSMRRDLSKRSSKSIVGGGGSLWRVQWKMKARVLEPVRHRTRHRHCGRCTPSYSRMASDELISYLSWPRSPGHDSRSATSSVSQYYLARNLVAAPRRRRLRRALWAALIIHARSALVSVRTPLRSVKLNLCYDAGTRQQAHARTTARGVAGGRPADPDGPASHH